MKKNNIFKKTLILNLIAIIMITLATAASAETLEEALATKGETTYQVEENIDNQDNNKNIINNNNQGSSLTDTNNQTSQVIDNSTTSNQGQDYINGLQQIDLTQTPDSQTVEIVNGVNKAIYKTQSFIVQIIAYALTIMLTLRTLFDLTYIAIPFSRSPIDKISGQTGSTGGNMGQNMGNMGQSMGQSFGGQMRSEPQAATSGATNIQIISDEARAAIQSPHVFRTYAKSMTVTLIATTVMLVLALTGALTDLGFLIGKALTAALGKVKIIL